MKLTLKSELTNQYQHPSLHISYMHMIGTITNISILVKKKKTSSVNFAQSDATNFSNI